MKKLLWIASLCAVMSVRTACAGPEAQMVLVYWDASVSPCYPARSQLADLAILQRCVVADRDYPQAGSEHHFDGYLVGLAVRFGRAETGRTVLSARSNDYDEAARYVASFPDHYIFSRPALKK
jgi:hypothetical protein